MRMARIHRLRCLNTWYSVVGTIWEKNREYSFLEAVVSLGIDLTVLKAHSIPN